LLKHLRTACAVAALSCSLIASAQNSPGAVVGSWQPLTTQPPFGGALVPILLTDGSVLIQDGNNVTYPFPVTNHWWKLTPDANGSYVNGTWTQVHDAASDHAPLFYSSAVLADGRVVVCGGEYNLGSQVWTSRSEIYDPVANTWADITPPFSPIGDSECVVLPNGKFMLTNIAFEPIGQTPQMAVLDPTTLTWSSASVTGKEADFDEENWTLLPDGTILTVDIDNTPHAEKYVIANDNWVPAGSTPAAFTNSTTYNYEMGPAVLRFDGTVMAFGANSNTAIYTPPAIPTDPGSWAAGPTLPGGQGLADGTCCLLPNGNVLFAASAPPIYNGTPTYFYETDGTSLFPAAATPRAGSDDCFNITFLVLPNGQVMQTDSSNDIEIYTPSGSPQDAWRPTITGAPSTVKQGSDYLISGTQFNGLSQTNAYGDDWSNATNYPIVRITNNGTGHVKYCRTHDHSTMGVATGSTPVSTHFLVPSDTELGASTIEVVANGIPSASQAIDVIAPNIPPVANAGPDQTVEATGPTTQFTLDGTASTDPDSGPDPLTYTWYDSTHTQVGTGSTLQLSRGLGVYTFTLEVNDGIDTNTDSVQITIQDTTPPAFGTLSDITVTATGNSGTPVTYGPFYATDLVDGSILATASPVSGSLFPPGSTQVTLSATDLSSNTGHGYFNVIVHYSWSGFLSPFPKEPFKMGSNIPVKFKLTGASAGITNLVATGYWNNGGPNHLIGTFTYSLGQYQLNFKTTGVPKGTINIVVTFDDGTTHTIPVVLK